MRVFLSFWLILACLGGASAQVKKVVLTDFNLSPSLRGTLSDQAGGVSASPGEGFLKLSSLASLPSVENAQLGIERQSARLLMSLAAEPASKAEQAQLVDLLGKNEAQKLEKAVQKLSSLRAKDQSVRAALDGIAAGLAGSQGAQKGDLFRRFYAGERILSETAADGPEIHPERTAMARSGPSVPTKLAESLMAGEILDYGAGRGADSAFLKEKGHAVTTYDPYYFPQKPAEGRRFDWAQLNYVLNVVPEGKVRAQILDEIYRRLKPGGRFLVSVRTNEEMAAASKGKGWKRHGDGWITSLNTFQHGFSDKELTAYLKARGFTVERFLAPGIAVAARTVDVRRSWRAVLKSLPFGKKLPGDVYLHRSTIEKLPPRVLEAVRQAEKSLPKNARWALAKLSMDGKSISFLWYPDFDAERHPALDSFYRVDLKTGAIEWTDHSKRENKFILHRKESFVDLDYPQYLKFKSETAEEEAAGLLGRADIGTEEGWKKALKKAGW